MNEGTSDHRNARQTIVMIANECGLHARPAALLSKLAHRFTAEIELFVNGRSANARSIVGLLFLGAENGREVLVSADGHDAEEALHAITALFAANFHEEPVRPRVAAPAARGGETGRGNGRTILVADDDAHIRNMIRQILDSNGYRTLLAHNGREAVSAYAEKAWEVDVVVLDMIMPELSGLDAYRSIRRMNNGQPILAISGSMNASPFPEDDASAFLQKPFHLPDLLATLDSLIARRTEITLQPDYAKPHTPTPAWLKRPPG